MPAAIVNIATSDQYQPFGCHGIGAQVQRPQLAAQAVTEEILTASWKTLANARRQCRQVPFEDLCATEIARAGCAHRTAVDPAEIASCNMKACFAEVLSEIGTKASPWFGSK
jgi:hypothetical protein